MNFNKILKVLSGACLFTVLIKASMLCKLSFIFGSYTAFFSGSNCITPLSGAFGGVGNVGAVFGLNCLFRLLFFGFNPFKLLVYHVPGLFASSYWALNHWITRLLVPFFCMILFIAHPVGLYAIPYALFWLIPIVLYFKKQKNLFLHSFSSTFIAHAVGSVIWLYVMPSTPGFWVGLIPIVIFERILFASGMVVMYNVIHHCINILNSLRPSIVSLFNAIHRKVIKKVYKLHS